MATITSFEKWHIQPSLEVNGQEINVEEDWLLILNERSSNIAANALIKALTAGNAYGWPLIGVGTHPDDSNLVAVNYTLDRDEDAGYKYIVTLSYTNNVDVISASMNKTTAFTDAGNSYDYEEVTITEEVDFDPIVGNAIAATNGEAYWPKLTRERTLDRIIVTRNEPRFKPEEKKIYRNKVNSVATYIDGYIYEARSLRMLSITGKRQIGSDGEIYYVVRYILLYDPDGLHKKTLLDVAVGPDLNGKFPSVAGTRSYKPTKLDGAGVYLAKADQRDPSVYFTNDFNLYGEVNIDPLRL